MQLDFYHGLLGRRRPLPRTALGLGYLVSGQKSRQAVSSCDEHLSLVAIGFGGEAYPHVGGHKILRHVDASPVGGPEAELSQGVSLNGRTTPPPHCLSKVLLNALALGFEPCETDLREGVPLVGCEAPPLDRLGIVRRNVLSGRILDLEGLSGGVSLVGSTTIPANRFGMVLGDPSARSTSDRAAAGTPVVSSSSTAVGCCPHLGGRIALGD